MISFLLSILSLFPVSFFLYSLSERFIAKHQLRVGKQIAFSSFIYQTWIDAKVDLTNTRGIWTWVMYFLQILILFLFELDIQYVIFIYLAANVFILAQSQTKNGSVINRIEYDRIQVKQIISSIIALLCAYGCFITTKDTSLASIHWEWSQVFFIIPFQFAGMMMFGEHPFEGMSKKVGWLQSARFYVWSMLAVKLFLGGGYFFFDFHAKAAILYVFCRLVGTYVPTIFHRDLLRVSILYLIPITGLLWLFAMILHGITEGSHV